MGTNHNHAKLGVSKDPKKPLSIFGDMNQQGAIHPSYVYADQRCSSSQNGRGGNFYVLENQAMFESMTAFFKVERAQVGKPAK